MTTTRLMLIRLRRNSNLTLKEKLPRKCTRAVWKKKLYSLRKKISCFNLTKGRGNTLNLLHDDTSIIIREADKGSVVVPLNREDYLGEANNQLSDKDVIQKVL